MACLLEKEDGPSPYRHRIIFHWFGLRGHPHVEKADVLGLCRLCHNGYVKMMRETKANRGDKE